MSISVLVLLATHNCENFIKIQIETILCQLGVNITVIAQDDCSNDSTKIILREYERKYANFYVRDNLNGFGSGGLNFINLISNCDINNYDYVAFSDQDDVWAPNKLLAAIELMQMTGSQCYSSDLISYDAKKRQAWWLKKSQKIKKLDYVFQGASAGCTYLLSREAAEVTANVLKSNLNLISKSTSHDWLIYAICRSYDFKWILDEQAYIFYRQHGANLYGARKGFRELLYKSNPEKIRWYLAHIKSIRPFLRQSPILNNFYERIDRLSFMDRVALLTHIFDFRRSKFEALCLGLMILLYFRGA